MTATFAVSSSLLAPRALAEQALPEFGIGPGAEVRFFSGGFNHTYRVRAADGRVFYLRAYRRRWRTLADVRYELAVLAHLERKGFPAARPVRTRAGELYLAVAAPEGERYLALFTEAPGPEVSYEHEPAGMAQRYGRAVARMHKSLDDFHCDEPRFQLDLAFFVERPLRFIEPFLAERPEEWATVRGFAELLREHIVALPAEALAQGFCHGDLQGYHANVAADGTLTFFDFDCGGWGFRAYDLGVFLWCCRLEGAVEARWEHFVRGYGEMRPLPEIELRAAPLFACARYLWHMGVHAENSPDWGIDFLGDGYWTGRMAGLRQAAADYMETL